MHFALPGPHPALKRTTTCLNRPAPLLTEEAASDTEGAKVFSLSTCSKENKLQSPDTSGRMASTSTGKLGAARCSSASGRSTTSLAKLMSEPLQELQQLKECRKETVKNTCCLGKTQSEFSPALKPCFCVQDVPILQERVTATASLMRMPQACPYEGRRVVLANAS